VAAISVSTRDVASRISLDLYSQQCFQRSVRTAEQYIADTAVSTVSSAFIQGRRVTRETCGHRDGLAARLGPSSAHVFRSGWRWIVDHSVCARTRQNGRPTASRGATAHFGPGFARRRAKLQAPPAPARCRAVGGPVGRDAPLSRSSGSEFAGWPTARHVRNTRLAGFGHGGVVCWMCAIYGAHPAHNLRLFTQRETGHSM